MILAVTASLFSGGCLGRGQTDLLQVRLREQQRMLVEAQSQLDKSERELLLARKEAEGLRSQLASSGPPGYLPEHSAVLIRAASLRINPMLTAGFERDEAYGDDVRVLQFTPLDDRDEVIRLPGDIRIRVLDAALAPEQQTVAEWTFTAAESRNHWVKGLLGSGYQFSLPWPEPPKNANLVLHVQLTSTDGREFKATHLLKITPPVVTADVREATAVREPARNSVGENAGRENPLLENSRRDRDVVPAGAAETRKPSITRPVVEESTNWTLDDVPVYR